MGTGNVVTALDLEEGLAFLNGLEWLSAPAGDR